jgi:hypothetical protein
MLTTEEFVITTEPEGNDSYEIDAPYTLDGLKDVRLKENESPMTPSNCWNSVVGSENTLDCRVDVLTTADTDFIPLTYIVRGVSPMANDDKQARASWVITWDILLIA